MHIKNSHHGHHSSKNKRPQGGHNTPAPPPQDGFQKGHGGNTPSTESIMREMAKGPYYDAERDQREQARYYSKLVPSDSPQEFFHQLSDLVTDTHQNKRGYNPDELLYPWVDLQPSLRLQSLYSDKPVQAGDPLHIVDPKDYAGDVSNKQAQGANLQQLQHQAEAWTKILAQGGTDAGAIAMKIAEVEARTYYNCEHVVPRVWFADQNVPEGDLHHLFACEKDINAERSSRRLVEVTNPTETFAEGVKGQLGEFEPAAGKGQAARATLYFLLRYPGKVGDHPFEYNRKDIETLLKWNAENPVTLHEKHRNQAIATIQGNRNPFIDHPEWASKVDFTRGVGVVPANWTPPPPREPAGPRGKKDWQH